MTLSMTFRYDSLRIAYVDIVDKMQEDKETKEYKSIKEYYSKLIKADADGKDQVPYWYRLRPLSCT